MTTYVENETIYYRFIHDKIFHFVVSSYLYNSNKQRDFNELNSHLRENRDKQSYWSDVIEFWGEFLSDKVTGKGNMLERYKDFILSAGAFDANILKNRLHSQWRRLCDRVPSVTDLEFNDRLLILIVEDNIDP